MKIHRFALCAAFAWLGSASAALAQPASAPDLSASAPGAPSSPAAPPAPVRKTGPRLLTPAESRDSATVPGDLRPERRVTPQISVPLGKRAPAPNEPASRPGRAAAAVLPAGDIDDAAARCEAQRGEQVRAKCRDELARQGRAR